MNLILQGHDKLHVVCPLDVKFKSANLALLLRTEFHGEFWRVACVPSREAAGLSIQVSTLALYYCEL